MARNALPAPDDILDAISGIENATKGKSVIDVQSDWLLRRGIERGIEIISEASRRIPADLKADYPEIPWRDVATIGNILRHEYQSIAGQIIWNVVQVDLPALKQAVKTIAASNGLEQ